MQKGTAREELFTSVLPCLRPRFRTVYSFQEVAPYRNLPNPGRSLKRPMVEAVDGTFSRQLIMKLDEKRLMNRASVRRSSYGNRPVAVGIIGYGTCEQTV